VSDEEDVVEVEFIDPLSKAVDEELDAIVWLATVEFRPGRPCPTQQVWCIHFEAHAGVMIEVSVEECCGHGVSVEENHDWLLLGGCDFGVDMDVIQVHDLVYGSGCC